MLPTEIGAKYDKLASWWSERHDSSDYGLKQFLHTLSFCQPGPNVLDVGCGAGGRFIREMTSRGCKVTGIDVSKEMISIAKQKHPNEKFLNADICEFKTTETFDFIFAWDSIFHLPLNQHELVLKKFSRLLNPQGILMYTFGNAVGEHQSEWHNDTFHYSSIGINDNLKILMDEGLNLLHLELDQFPEKHVFLIAQKLQ